VEYIVAMKRILATAALVSLVAACSSATEDSADTSSPDDPTTTESPATEGPGTESPSTEAPSSGAPSDEPTTDAPEPSTDAPEPSEDGTGTDDADFSAFTLDATHSAGFPDLLGMLLPVGARIGGHDGYDRLVIDYEGEGQLEWSAAYTDTPTQDGSGFAVELDGDAFLSIDVSGVRYPEEGEMTGEVTVSGLTQSSIIADVEVDGPFEGMHSVHVGLDAERPYHVQTFSDPARLVIDFRND